MRYPLRPSSSRQTECPLFLAWPGQRPSPLAVRSTGEVVLPVPLLSAVTAALEETREAVSVVCPERNETDMLIVLLQGEPVDVGRELSVRERKVGEEDGGHLANTHCTPSVCGKKVNTTC